jgi:hypothetical protein
LFIWFLSFSLTKEARETKETKLTGRAMNPRIVIIDYGMGNLRNVQKGFEKIGFEAKLTRNKKEIGRLGNYPSRSGAFKDCIKIWKGMDSSNPCSDPLKKGNPIWAYASAYKSYSQKAKSSVPTRAWD